MEVAREKTVLVNVPEAFAERRCNKEEKMPDAPEIHLGENSPEHVAYKLFLNIAAVEGKLLHQASERSPQNVANRKWILDTYAECLTAVRNPHSRVD